MTTVHIENTVRDFGTWKANFDKYERFRAEQGVQSYRVSRSLTEPNEVLIDLEFCDQTAAQAFLPQLEKIMGSPQARAQLVRHSAPTLPGPTSQTPLLQAKIDVSMAGSAVAAAAGRAAPGPAVISAPVMIRLLTCRGAIHPQGRPGRARIDNA